MVYTFAHVSTEGLSRLVVQRGHGIPDPSLPPK